MPIAAVSALRARPPRLAGDSTTAPRPHTVKYPHAAGTPMRLAPAAPGKAMSDSVCPANACRRRTMNQPTTAAITATAVPATSALTMKW